MSNKHNFELHYIICAVIIDVPVHNKYFMQPLSVEFTEPKALKHNTFENGLYRSLFIIKSTC